MILAWQMRKLRPRGVVTLAKSSQPRSGGSGAPVPTAHCPKEVCRTLARTGLSCFQSWRLSTDLSAWWATAWALTNLTLEARVAHWPLVWSSLSEKGWMAGVPDQENQARLGCFLVENLKLELLFLGHCLENTPSWKASSEVCGMYTLVLLGRKEGSGPLPCPIFHVLEPWEWHCLTSSYGHSILRRASLDFEWRTSCARPGLALQVNVPPPPRAPRS